MRHIASLNARITIQKSEPQVDAIGNHLDVWVDHFKCNAGISGEAGYQLQDAGHYISYQTTTFQVRYCSETKEVKPTTHRIIWSDTIFDIHGIIHKNNDHDTIKFVCEEARAYDNERNQGINRPARIGSDGCPQRI